MFLAAFKSRSSTVPQAAQVHWRTWSGLGPSVTPHVEQRWLVGSNRPIFLKTRPYRTDLYSSILVKAAHPASWTLLASRPRARPITHRSST